MPPDRRQIARLFAALATWLLVGATAQPAGDAEAFEKEIRPLLVEGCIKCHGPDKQEGGLRLDSRRELLRGGDSGPAVVEGHPQESLLIEAVRREGDLKMPPNRGLAPERIAALVRWVAAGVPWPEDRLPAVDLREDAWAKHWAFRTVLDHPPPPVRDAAWCLTPVDAFIKAGLEAKGLDPAPPLDRRLLIRRVTYDLTGLPPTPDEVREFVADEAPDAYARAVDRLLASERYGEHWARHWLDVARYSDTKGYVYDREERFLVQAPAYRDWIIRTFNSDLPYDRFLIDQIAADRAAPDDPSALAAMGFLTVGRRFLGVTHDIIDDRIDVVTRGTMGLTVACARCHDHKYDPIPTADYYSLYGVFQNCTERLVPLPAPGPTDPAFEAGLAERLKKLREGMGASRAEASRRARARLADYLLAQRDLASVPQEGFDTVIGADDLNPATVRRWQTYLADASRSDDPIFRPWRRFMALKDDEFATRAPFEFDSLIADGSPPLNRSVAAAFATPPASIREVAERYGRLFDDVERLRKDERMPGDTAASPPPDPDVEALARVLEGERSPCAVPDEPIVTTEWFFDSATVVRMWKLQGEVDRWLIRSPAAPPYAVAVVDRDEIREPRIFRRGNPANRSDEVPRRFLRAIAGPGREPFRRGSGRLELARAIADPANPLTARVWVNRIWMHHFGAGLVRTPSDFGLRAEPPSHPELLDWLARRLVEGGWSTKSIHRTILLSNAYRQSSREPEDPAARELADRVDPENRLLRRMNPHRLTFEEARDSLLAVTLELDHRPGGRSSALFDPGTKNARRTLYGLVDRQFLPGVLRAFDFANPDLHIPIRSETTVPQQALFALNHPFVADRARALAARLPDGDAETTVLGLYRAVYQREPTPSESRAALAFLASPGDEPGPTVRPESLAWRYGYGPVDPTSGPSREFHPLPHFDGSAWGGGPRWPDAKLGWARLSAEGGHPGDDLGHATIRRWTAPQAGAVTIKSTLTHAEAVGDGVRAWVNSGRLGMIKSATAHNGKAALDCGPIAVVPGDTIDFVVDIRDGLNSDQHLWAIRIEREGGGSWDSGRDFAGPSAQLLNPREQLAQVLLMANEFMFVD